MSHRAIVFVPPVPAAINPSAGHWPVAAASALAPSRACRAAAGAVPLGFARYFDPLRMLLDTPARFMSSSVSPASPIRPNSVLRASGESLFQLVNKVLVLNVFPTSFWLPAVARPMRFTTAAA